jgi:hypothetical protein
MTQKTDFSSFRSLDAAAFQSCSLLQASQHLKQISTSLFEAIFRVIFNHLNVIGLDE